jgi:hypothetical protein
MSMILHCLPLLQRRLAFVRSSHATSLALSVMLVLALLLVASGMVHQAAAASSHLLAGPTCGGSTGWCAVNHLN